MIEEPKILPQSPEKQLEQRSSKQEQSEKEHFQEVLDLMKQKKQEKDQIPIEEAIKDLIFDLPGIVQKRVINKYNELKKGGFTESQLRLLIEERLREAKESYTDKRFELPNKNFGKTEVITIIDNMIEDGMEEQDLKKVARISFDLNGLKSVNDLTGTHGKGDDYLKLMASTLKKAEVSKWLDAKNITAIVTADGGDEFGMILKAGKPLETEILNELVEMITSDLWNNDEASSILDFDDEEVLLNFGGIDKKEWKLKNRGEQEKILQNIKDKIPDGYKYKAAVSAGATTLYESLKTINIDDDSNYEDALHKLMGSIFDISDKIMDANKKEFKKGLRESSDPYENFLGRVYLRTEEARGIEEENARMRELTEKIKKATVLSKSSDAALIRKLIEEFEVSQK